MFKLRTIWLVILALLLLSSSLIGQGPGVRAANTRKFALVIGIGQEYRHPAFRTLQYPEQDARAMAERLQKLGFEVVRVIGGEATSPGIRSGFDQLAQKADHPTDLVVIYFSGHGAIQKTATREMPSLVPADAVPDRPTTFITDTELGTWLGYIHSRRIWLVLDSCYSAGIGGGEKRLTDPEQMSPREVQARLQRIQQAEFVGALFQSAVILASSQARETSKEVGRKGGLFTYYLLQGLGEETRGTCPACEEGTNAVTPRSWLEYAAQGVVTSADQQPQLREPETGEQLALLVPWIKPMPGATVRPRATLTPVPTPVVSPEPTAAFTPSPPPSPLPATIVLKLNVSGVDVSVNGSLVQSGVGPTVQLTDQLAGSYYIEVSKPGYLPRTLTVTLQEGERKQLVANLAPRPAPTGKLTITTDPTGATVEIGGKTYKTPMTGLSLKPGTYTISISKNKYQSQQEQVVVEENRESRYSYQLVPVVRPRPTAVPTPRPVVVHTPHPRSPTRLPASVPAEYFQFVRIPAGTFLMGSPVDEPGRYDDEIQHEITISRPFEMQATEVTQALWQAVMGSNPSDFRRSDLPVENVSWDDVQQFIAKMNRWLGTNAYRLPTEAEWEYAARAGTTTPFWTGNNLTTDEANYNGNYPYNGNTKGQYRQMTTPVRTFPANPWGLYDTHGNVWEWVEDWYGAYPSGSVTDPRGPSTGSNRVLRGGSWFGEALICRSADRRVNDPGYRNGALGFRLARTVY